MRTLRQALAEAMRAPHDRCISLFRPGGFGKPAIWLSAEEVARLHAYLARAPQAPDRAAV